jgi:rSAM/selenodomain-associated transferase 1
MQCVVMAKEPLAGRVKTRLTPPFTPDHAALLARASLEDTLRTVQSAPAARHVLVLDGEPGPWLPSYFAVIAQRGNGLAERLAAAFEDCMRQCSEPIVLVGMDTPQLTAASLVAAGATLRRVSPGRRPRAVIGPATDGGYWLLGLSTSHPRAFWNVEMSTDRTYRQQVGQLHRCGYAITHGPELRDVDTIDDAAVVACEAPDTLFSLMYRQMCAAEGAPGPGRLDAVSR